MGVWPNLQQWCGSGNTLRYLVALCPHAACQSAVKQALQLVLQAGVSRTRLTLCA